MIAGETKDLVVQLRQRGMSKVVLAGMLANPRTEWPLRELVEHGFEVRCWRMPRRPGILPLATATLTVRLQVVGSIRLVYGAAQPPAPWPMGALTGRCLVGPPQSEACQLPGGCPRVG